MERRDRRRAGQRCRGPSASVDLLSRLPPVLSAGTESTDTSTYFVSKEAILFNADVEMTTTNLALCLSVVEFNLALTFHLRCLQGGSPKALSRALSLYGSCLLHLGHAVECKDASAVLVAALNNKGQLVEQELGNVQQARRWLQALLDAVTLCHGNPGILTASEIDEIMLNILTFRDLRVAAAA